MANTSRHTISSHNTPPAMSPSPRSSRRRRSISVGGSSTEPAPPMSARCHAAALGIRNMHLASDSHLANTSRMSLSPRSSGHRRRISTGGSSTEAPRLPPPPRRPVVRSPRCLSAALENMHLASDSQLANTSRMSLSPRSSRRRRTISTGGSSADPSPPLSARCVAAALGIRNMHLASDSHLANTSRMSLSPRSSGLRRSISTGGSSAEAPRLPPPPRRPVVSSPRCLSAALENMQLASDFHLPPGSILEGGKSIVSDLFNNDPSGMTGPHLIIAPHMVLMVWLEEFLIWLPSFTTIVYDGKSEERKTIRDRYFGDGKFNVLLTSYDWMVEDKKFLSKLSWYYLINDQGEQQLSNQMRTYVDNIQKAYDYKCSFFVQNLV